MYMIVGRVSCLHFHENRLENDLKCWAIIINDNYTDSLKATRQKSITTIKGLSGRNRPNVSTKQNLCRTGLQIHKITTVRT